MFAVAPTGPSHSFKLGLKTSKSSINNAEPHRNKYNFVLFSGGRDSSVGIATCYGLDDPGIESRWEARFFAHVQTGPGAPPSLLYNGYRVFPGGKAAGGWC
jgi:hypothetical protein